MIRGLVAGSYFQCGAQTLWSPKRYHSGQCIVVNFKQIQEVFVEALAIYLKYVEAFLRQYSTDLLQWDSKQPIKEALRLVLMQSAMPWLWPSLTNRSLRVATRVDLRVGNVLSRHDLRAFINFLCEKWMPFQWYGKTDIKAAWVALASMMLPSGAELPKSLTDYVNCKCSVQPVAFEW